MYFRDLRIPNGLNMETLQGIMIRRHRRDIHCCRGSAPYGVPYTNVGIDPMGQI